MNKKKEFLKVSVAIIVAIVFIIPSSSAFVNNEQNGVINTESLDFTHTVFAEAATATTCSFCRYSHAALKTIYASGDYPFYYVSLVCNKNFKAYMRVKDDYNVAGYPTVWFDGGYEVDVGGNTGNEAQYRSSIDSCINRSVSDIDINLAVAWLGGTEMKIDVSVDNNESSIYDGTIRVYITEIVSSMGWKDTAGYLYTFPFLDWAFNEEISISAEGIWSDSTTWDGSAHGFSSITEDNIMIIAAVFNDEWHQGYSSPPNGNPFDAYYVDETTAATPNGNSPPNRPSTPSGPTNGVVGVEYTYTSSTMDLDGDDVYYLFDWDDGTDSGWLGPYNSGDIVVTSHTWTGEGIYHMLVKAKDVYGAESAWSDPLTIHNNHPPYEPSNPMPSNGSTGVSINASLSWTGGDPDGDPLTYALQKPGTSDLDLEGVLIANVTAVEIPADVFDGSVTVVEQGNDTTPPVTTCTIDPPEPDGENGWYVSVVTVTLVATDDDSGVESTWYRIDSDYWKLYQRTFEVSKEGEHTLEFYSFDRAGNREDTKTTEFKIDAVSPVTTHEFDGVIGKEGWFVSNVTVTISATDATSGVNYTKYKLDDGELTTYTEPFDVTENGEYTLYYYSVDLAGNNETTNEVAFKIEHDVVPPVTTHEFDGVMGDNDWFTSNVVVTLTAEDNLAGVNYTKYNLNDVDWITYVDPFVVIEDGNYTLYYYSVDLAGNMEPMVEVDFKIVHKKTTYDVYFGTVSPPPKVVSNQSETTYDPGTMDYGTKYYWQIVAWDSLEVPTEGDIWSFTTELADIDIIPPEIISLTLTASDPLDTIIGWENFSCTVTDNVAVDEVKIVLTGDAITEYPMIKDGDDYYCNITISTADEYTYHIWADDTSDNQDTSPLEQFELPPNEDVDMNGQIHFMDLVAIVIIYGDTGPDGWIREDIDNGGKVHFMDMVAISMHYNEVWK